MFTAPRRVLRPWPHTPAPLTPEQERIREDWVAHWLESNSKTPLVNVVDRFNHGYPLRSVRRGARTLEIGAGVGMHCKWEDLESQDYYCNELTDSYVETIRRRYPRVKAAVGDCQARLSFDDGFFDRILAIHVLEHLPDLPKCLDEVSRLLAPDGVLSVVIPCEAGLLYELARIVSSKRMFESRYHESYDWLIKSEHVSSAWEVLAELHARFDVDDETYFPSRVPSIDTNIAIGLTLRHKRSRVAR